MAGFRSFRYFAVPDKVPPVPAESEAKRGVCLPGKDSGDTYLTFHLPAGARKEAAVKLWRAAFSLWNLLKAFSISLRLEREG